MTGLLVALAILSTLSAGLEIDPRRLNGPALARPVAGALLAGALVAPLAAWPLLHALPLAADVRAALFLVALAPGGASAPLLARLAGGEPTPVAATYLALAITSLTLVPLLSGTGAPAARLLGLVTAQLAPLAVGLGLRLRRPRLADRLGPSVRRAGNALLLAVIVVLAIARGGELGGLGPATLVAITGVVALTMLAGAAFAPAPRAAGAVLGGVRNLTLALLVVETSVAEGRATLVVAAYGLVMYVAAALTATAFRARTRS